MNSRSAAQAGYQFLFGAILLFAVGIGLGMFVITTANSEKEQAQAQKVTLAEQIQSACIDETDHRLRDMGLCGEAEEIVESTGAEPSSIKGERGEQGIQGTQGASGPKGQEGPRGKTGEQGKQGIAGEPGIDGLPGPKGDKGDDGVPGADSTVAGPPGDTITGISVDCVAKVVTATTSSGGVVSGPARCEAGPQGEPGPVGPTGPAGPQGPKGEPGSAGPGPTLAEEP